MRAMQVIKVGLDEWDRPLLLLRESGGQGRILPVWIGEPEAGAIAAEQLGIDQPRPLTHALLAQVIIALGRELRKVTITALHESSFLAELDLDHGIRVSARVSDAVAVALHLRVPIWAEDMVLDQAGVSAVDLYSHDSDPSGEGNRIDENEVARLREFLETASPEDFNPS